MPKIGEKKPAAKAKAKTKAAPKKDAPKKPKKEPEDPALFWSDEDDEQQEAIIILGEICAGKTYCAATASDFFPKSLPSKKWVDLDDMFWFQTDRKATAGFKGDRLRVRTFDILRFMTFPDIYEAEGFNTQPSWAQAVEVGIRKAHEFADRCFAEGLRPKIVVDTLTGFDVEQFNHAKQEAERIEAEGGRHNQYRAFAIHGDWHQRFFSDLIASGADCIFCSHQRAAWRGSSLGEKDKNVTVRVAGMEAEFVPDLIGNIAPKLYKRHTSLQLIMRAYKVKERGVNRIKREILIGVNDYGGEAKNRYERALAPLGGKMSPPDLGRILEMIRI
jgi:hypothetical protein